MVKEKSIPPSNIALGIFFAHDNRVFCRVRKEEGEAIVKLIETGEGALVAKGRAARSSTSRLLEKIRILEIKFGEDEIESKEK